MTAPKKVLHERLVFTAIQTLLFGGLLAAFGYWLDGRLETHRHELAARLEETKSLFAALVPDVQERRRAYKEYLSVVRSSMQTLQTYYGRADTPSEQQQRYLKIASLRSDLEGGSFGGSGSWAGTGDVVVAIDDIIRARQLHQDDASDEINEHVDNFIDVVVQDLKASAQPSNDNAQFHNAARQRLDREYESVVTAIEGALGLDQLPVK